ncbi:MAG: cobalt ECF transporter T component CbiQ [Desulfuromonadales bacterium]
MRGVPGYIDAQGENRRLLVVLDGRIKLTLLIAALLVNLTAGGLIVPLFLAALAFFLVVGSGVPQKAFLKRIAVPVMLAFFAFLTQLFWFKEGATIVLSPFDGWDLTIYSGGIVRGLELAARIVGGMAVLLFFALTTPLPELMKAARFFRCPPVLVELGLIMYRYIFLLFEETGRIRNAQKARVGFTGFRNSLRSSGILGGMLVLRTYDRAERSFAAMRCRGYCGLTTTAPPPTPLQGYDWTVLILGVLGLTGLYYIG